MLFIQSDNGGEYRDVLKILLQRYGCMITHGRVRHPQTQGGVVHGNGTFKSKPERWMVDNPEAGWIRSLPEIVIAMNISKHRATNKAAYLVVSREWEVNDDRLLADIEEQDLSHASTPSGSTEHDTSYLLADIEVEQGPSHIGTPSDFEQQVQVTSESRDY